jgi:hypothetical protein
VDSDKIIHHNEADKDVTNETQKKAKKLYIFLLECFVDRAS